MNRGERIAMRYEGPMDEAQARVFAQQIRDERGERTPMRWAWPIVQWEPDPAHRYVIFDYRDEPGYLAVYERGIFPDAERVWERDYPSVSAAQTACSKDWQERKPA